MESKAIGSGILAFNAGIGKTLSCLLHHYNQYRKKLLAHNARVAAAGSKKEKLPVYKPSIVICPAMVVAVWFTEIQRYFGWHLQIRLNYSDGNEDVITQEQKGFLLSLLAKEAVKQLQSTYKKNDPKTESVIVITSYETFTKRCLKPVKRFKDVINLQREGLIDEREAHAPTIGEILLSTAKAQEGLDETDNLLHMAITNKELVPKITSKTKNQKKSNNSINNQTYKYMNIMRGVFRCIFINEGQKIKNPKSNNNKAIFTAYTDYYWVVSATPMLNRAQDLLGYLTLMWRPSWSVEWHTDSDQESDFWIYKLDKRQEFLEQCKADSALYSTKFKRYATATNDCLFALNPKMFACVINKDLMKGEMAYNVLGTILGIIQFKASSATQFQVNGAVITADDNMKMCQSTMVKIQGSPYKAAVLEALFKALIPHLYLNNSNTDDL
ncbi:uncharacterized protein HMPREF1541_07795, partial [Cyphellophora europaea CBS 101466]